MSVVFFIVIIMKGNTDIINEKVHYGLLKPILDSDMTDEEKLLLLAEDGMLVKRPILVKGSGTDMKVAVGFKEAEWEELI